MDSLVENLQADEAQLTAIGIALPSYVKFVVCYGHQLVFDYNSFTPRKYTCSRHWSSCSRLGLQASPDGTDSLDVINAARPLTDSKRGGNLSLATFAEQLAGGNLGNVSKAQQI